MKITIFKEIIHAMCYDTGSSIVEKTDKNKKNEE
jgi:hypothetical protein